MNIKILSTAVAAGALSFALPALAQQVPPSGTPTTTNPGTPTTDSAGQPTTPTDPSAAPTTPAPDSASTTPPPESSASTTTPAPEETADAGKKKKKKH